MAKSYKGVIQHFEAAPEQVQASFPEFVKLAKDYSWEVVVSYAHSRVEQVKRMTIYCGIVKLHRCESELTKELVSADYMARDRFRKLFKIVYGRNIPDDLLAKLKTAETVRDKIAHGMRWEPKEAREGLTSLVDFATGFNNFLHQHAGIRPFGDLRGFKGRKEPLTKQTTGWVLRGMGIPQRSNE